MLPNKVFQLDYQNFSIFVEKDIEKIIKYENDNKIKFDCIIAKLRHGTFPGSIIANNLQIPMGVLEAPRFCDENNYNHFLPQEINQKLSEGKKINILFTDGICGTGETLSFVEKFYSKFTNINLVTYCTMIDAKAKVKPKILGNVVNEQFIQPPWEWRSFTPQAHLDRIEIYNIKASPETENCFGFTNLELKTDIENVLEFSLLWTMIYEQQIQSTSGISTYDALDLTLPMNLFKEKYRKHLECKKEFILNNGLTHYFENNLTESILLSELCPVTKIIYYENGKFYLINSREINILN